LAALLLAAPACGGVIVQYSFTGPTWSATTLSAGATATAVTGMGTLSSFTIESGLGYSTSPVLKANPGGTVSNDVSTAFANGNYFYFTITPDAGMELDLVSLTFSAARGGSSTPRRTGVRTSVTGTTNLLAADVDTLRPTWSDFSVSLSGPQFQNLTGPVTFQIAVATPSTGSSLEFDDVTVNGEAAPLPEPATLALMGAGLGATLAVRRRRAAG
jgi:hypothetical protein